MEMALFTLRYLRANGRSTGHGFHARCVASFDMYRSWRNTPFMAKYSVRGEVPNHEQPQPTQSQRTPPWPSGPTSCVAPTTLITPAIQTTWKNASLNTTPANWADTHTTAGPWHWYFRNHSLPVRKHWQASGRSRAGIEPRKRH